MIKDNLLTGRSKIIADLNMTSDNTESCSTAAEQGWKINWTDIELA